MRLRFEQDLDFQIHAVNAVCDLFHGQENREPEVSVATSRLQSGRRLRLETEHLALGNRLLLTDEEILANLNRVQQRNGLPVSPTLESGDFTVEMETGTGKTYVYLRTILELNKRYGFTKFVIVVPSIAIKEGVHKTLEITEEHFRLLYSGTIPESFLYDSAQLGRLRHFATSSLLQIMVTTVGAINKKDVNNLYKDSEEIGGATPIELIKATQPILIVDEPQSVEGGLAGRGREALAAMMPLCTLRYSATHATEYHMVYRLDPVDAYERKLVKQIEVASATVADAHNRPYVRLISTSSRRGTVSATVDLDVERGGAVRRRRKSIRDGDELEQVTGRAVYRDCRVGEIRAGRNRSFLELRVPGSIQYLREGEAWGDVDATTLQRQMIRRTIREHMDKERRLRPEGIKVLSLFFVDAVEHYRRYDATGRPVKGECALMFEQEYRRLQKHPDYVTLFGDVDLAGTAEEVHGGYFSIDRKGGWTDTADGNQVDRENAERAYTLIMREKEELLRLDQPLKFIFSHSALREGWDNPNVFQICVLRDIRTERERRQTIGRGLRLCVNQRGERVHGFEANTLTVIARERYEDFAEKLQQEMELDARIRFGIVEPQQFAKIPVIGDHGRVAPFGTQRSDALCDHLRAEGFVDAAGRIQDRLRAELRDDTLAVPPAFAAQRSEIVGVLRKVAGHIGIRNADERQTVRPRQAVLDGAEFRVLWDRVKHKTTYRVAFDNERLLGECARALREAPAVPRARLQWRKADLAIGQGGVTAKETARSAAIAMDEADVVWPDLLTELQERTQLTRRSLHRILRESRRLEDFRRNPQHFVEVASQTIKSCKEEALVDGIKYQRIGDEVYYAQELFREKELVSYLTNMMGAQKCVHEKVVYESGVEARFAEDLEKNTAIKVYAKLPNWFVVPTPLGHYTPDWALLADSDAGERLYLVVETKASTLLPDLRFSERAKIKCGEAHFEALRAGESPAQYQVASSVDAVLATVESHATVSVP